MSRLIANMKTPNGSKKRLNLICHIYISTCANGKRPSAIETGHYTVWSQTSYKLISGHLTVSLTWRQIPTLHLFQPLHFFIIQTIRWIKTVSLMNSFVWFALWMDYSVHHRPVKQICWIWRRKCAVIELKASVDSST